MLSDAIPSDLCRCFEAIRPFASTDRIQCIIIKKKSVILMRHFLLCDLSYLLDIRLGSMCCR